MRISVGLLVGFSGESIIIRSGLPPCLMRRYNLSSITLKDSIRLPSGCWRVDDGI